jgi:hypothetical protein
MLKIIKSSSDLQWMSIGDFNELLHKEEHVSVKERHNLDCCPFVRTFVVVA